MRSCRWSAPHSPAQERQEQGDLGLERVRSLRPPSAGPDLSYTLGAAGGLYTVLLMSDGGAMSCGRNAEGRCDLPALVADLSYAQVAAGGCYTVLLIGDGSAAAYGRSAEGRCDSLRWSLI